MGTLTPANRSKHGRNQASGESQTILSKSIYGRDQAESTKDCLIVSLPNVQKAIKKPLPVGQQATVYAKDGEHTWSK